MIQLSLSQEQIRALEYERYHAPHPKVQRRMEAVYLKSKHLPHSEICRLCQITEKTLSTWLKLYRDSGLEGLQQLHYKGQPSDLNAQIDQLKTYFQEHPPRNSAEAQAKIEELTGIRRSPTQIKLFCKKIGLKLRKVGHVPGKAVHPDKIQEQDQFEQEQLQPRLQEAKEGKRSVFL